MGGGGRLQKFLGFRAWRLLLWDFLNVLTAFSVCFPFNVGTGSTFF